MLRNCWGGRGAGGLAFLAVAYMVNAMPLLGGGGWRGFAVDQDEHVEQSCNNSPFGSSEKACEIPS